MSNKSKYAIPALTVFVLNVFLCIYLLSIVAVFSRDKIVVQALATTGPDYEVVFGQLKLSFQRPDSIAGKADWDVWGVMLTDKSSTEMNNYINERSSWVFDDYYILTGKIVGTERSDGTAFLPLIEITSIKHFSKILFWGLVIMNIALFLLFRFFYIKDRAFNSPGN